MGRCTATTTLYSRLPLSKVRYCADFYTLLIQADQNQRASVFCAWSVYLQNAHKGGALFLEYMFHNLYYTDKGYTVIDMDYLAIAGYGRDCRTGIYRLHGGKISHDIGTGLRGFGDNTLIR